MGGKDRGHRKRDGSSAKGWMSLQQKVLGFSMSHTHEQEMPQEKFERPHVHPPASQGISSNAGGKNCTAMAVHNWDSDFRALMFRKEAGDRRSPQAAGKSVQT